MKNLTMQALLETLLIGLLATLIAYVFLGSVTTSFVTSFQVLLCSAIIGSWAIGGLILIRCLQGDRLPYWRTRTRMCAVGCPR